MIKRKLARLSQGKPLGCTSIKKNKSRGSSLLFIYDIVTDIGLTPFRISAIALFRFSVATLVALAC